MAAAHHGIRQPRPAVGAAEPQIDHRDVAFPLLSQQPDRAGSSGVKDKKEAPAIQPGLGLGEMIQACEAEIAALTWRQNAVRWASCGIANSQWRARLAAALGRQTPFARLSTSARVDG